MPAHAILSQLAAVALAILWIKTVLFRLSSDIAEVRESNDDMARLSIIVIWLLTVFVVQWLFRALYPHWLF